MENKSDFNIFCVFFNWEKSPTFFPNFYANHANNKSNFLLTQVLRLVAIQKIIPGDSHIPRDYFLLHLMFYNCIFIIVGIIRTIFIGICDKSV